MLPAEAAFDLVALLREEGAIGHGGHVDLDELDVESVTAQTPRLIEARTDEQSVQPRVEAIGAAQRGQITPRADKGFLDGVLGRVGIAENQASGGIQAENRGACQHGEGVMIAPLRSLHEFPLHGVLGGDAAHVVAFRQYGEATKRDRSELWTGSGVSAATSSHRPSP